MESHRQSQDLNRSNPKIDLTTFEISLQAAETAKLNFFL